MPILLASSAFHFSSTLPLQSYERLVVHRFPDGELSVFIDNLFPGQLVTLVASLQPPAENIVELLLTLNVLERSGVRINLVITYLGYARQDHALHGESLGIEFVAKLLKNYRYERLTIVHPHSLILEKFLSFESTIPLDFFCEVADENNVDIVVASDRGVQKLASAVADRLNKPSACLEKSRTDGNVKHSLNNGTKSFKGKKILLIDDIIVTGKTLMSAAQLCKQNGASSVIAAVTHRLYSTTQLAVLGECPIERFYVTNTVAQIQQDSRFIVLDITPYLVHSMMID